jgi:hypothetical protein
MNQNQNPAFPVQQMQPQQPVAFPQQQAQPQQPVAFPQQQAQPPQQMQPPQQGNPLAMLFDGIDSARTSQDSNYIRPGHYLMRIDRIKADTNQKGQPFLATELTVLHVFSSAEADKVGESAHTPGESVTDMKMKHHQSFLGNVRAMLAGIEGMAVEELQRQLAQSGDTVASYAVKLCGQDQPYAGMLVEVYAKQIMTRPKHNAPNGTPFTKVTYRREVRASELASIMAPEALQMFFGNGLLEQLLQHEQQIHGSAPQQ